MLFIKRFLKNTLLTQIHTDCTQIHTDSHRLHTDFIDKIICGYLRLICENLRLRYPFRVPIIIIFVILFSLNAGTSFGADDSFGPAKKIEGKHFIIYYVPQLEISGLSQELNISPSDKLLVGKSTEKEFSAEAEFADMLDTLFLQACNILDMHLYSFQGTLKICKDAAQLNRIYNYFFNKDINTRSFYVYSLNTIYTSEDNFTRGIIGHEIAHAIISHYFVVQPSVKIQEVLAGYIEYQLRKMER